MKKIPVSKRVWRQLCKIKNKQNLSSLSKVVEYLVDFPRVLKGENLQEIHRRVDELIKAKNFEEKSQDDNVLDFMCVQCGHVFKFDKVHQDPEIGLSCPQCDWDFNIMIFFDAFDDFEKN
jgi:rubrerythrin